MNTALRPEKTASESTAKTTPCLSLDCPLAPPASRCCSSPSFQRRCIAIVTSDQSTPRTMLPAARLPPCAHDDFGKALRRRSASAPPPCAIPAPGSPIRGESARLIAPPLIPKPHFRIASRATDVDLLSLRRKPSTDPHAYSHVAQLMKGRAKIILRQWPLLPGLLHYCLKQELPSSVGDQQHPLVFPEHRMPEAAVRDFQDQDPLEQEVIPQSLTEPPLSVYLLMREWLSKPSFLPSLRYHWIPPCARIADCLAEATYEHENRLFSR